MNESAARSFPLAPMSTAIRWLTTLLLVAPAGLAIAGLAVPQPGLFIPAAVLAGLDFTVWFVARPTRFEVGRDALMVIFPAWRRTISLAAGVSARLLDFKQFREEFGTPLRIGVGGLWGGFGWLWTSRRGLIEFYISRTHGFVLVERGQGRPLLITPENPEMMVEALAAFSGPAGASRRSASSPRWT
jgi:hypothetical protein